MMLDLSIIADDIREILEKKRLDLNLTFEEEGHIYEMKDLKGLIRNDWPSVSKIMKQFYDEFPTEEAAENKSNGDPIVKERLIKEWAEAGRYSTNLGSRAHYLLEKKSLGMFNLVKEIRQPIFDCDTSQIEKGDMMIKGGTKFLDLMKERGAVLLDTEVVLGSQILGYVGQADTIWLIMNKDKNGFGFLITDYKTNKPKNFLTNDFTKPMYSPFKNLPNTSLGHYKIQLPFYGKLLLDMLKDTKYGNIRLLGCIIVHLIQDGTFQEYRIDRNIIDRILTMDMNDYFSFR